MPKLTYLPIKLVLFQREFTHNITKSLAYGFEKVFRSSSAVYNRGRVSNIWNLRNLWNDSELRECFQLWYRNGLVCNSQARLSESFQRPNTSHLFLHMHSEDIHVLVQNEKPHDQHYGHSHNQLPRDGVLKKHQVNYHMSDLKGKL